MGRGFEAVFRPFGLKIAHGKVYVGGVCTGENGGDANDLSAFILEYDIATGTWRPGLKFELHQPDYGIMPYSAMLGALKVQPKVKVVFSAPAPDAA